MEGGGWLPTLSGPVFISFGTSDDTFSVTRLYSDDRVISE
jgi:hypothetical protein